MDCIEGGDDRKDECRREMSLERDFRSEIPGIVERVVSMHDKEGRFSHIGPEPIPSKRLVIDIIDRAIRIIYPGYFSSTRLDEVNVPYFFGQQVTELYQIMSEQVAFAIRHDCRRFDLPCTRCEERGQGTAVEFLKEIPGLQAMLAKDIAAAYAGDPAAKYHDEIIFSYPGLFAVTVYRIAHLLQ